jgi:predicted amidohydrolase
MVAFTGRSQILDPAGNVLVRANRTETCAMAADLDLDLARDKQLTPRTHLFHARRPGAYRPLVARRPVRS